MFDEEFKKKFEGEMGRLLVENQEKWRDLIEEIPSISFPQDWKIQIIPPFGGAIVRFRVWIPGMNSKEWVSIYLDVYNRLGLATGPYWEVYPYKGDTGRCLMDDTDELLKMIADRAEADT